MGFQVKAVIKAEHLPEIPDDQRGVMIKGDEAFIHCKYDPEDDNRIHPVVEVRDVRYYALTYSRTEFNGSRLNFTNLVVDSNGEVRKPFYVNITRSRFELYAIRYRGETTDFVLNVNRNGGVKVLQARIPVQEGRAYLVIRELYSDQLPFKRGENAVRSAIMDENLHFLIPAMMRAYRIVCEEEPREIEPFKKREAVPKSTSKTKTVSEKDADDKEAAEG